MSEVAKHVFIVDDEVMITRSLALILTREGFRVTTFTDPREALASMTGLAPDVLISDVMMPQLSGVDLAIATRERRPECKILLFSAAAHDHLECARAQGHHFRLLHKPIHPNRLLEEIQSL